METPEEGHPSSGWPGTPCPPHPAAGRTLKETRTRRAGQERGPILEPTTPQASDPRTAHPRAHAGCSEGRAGA